MSHVTTAMAIAVTLTITVTLTFIVTAQPALATPDASDSIGESFDTAPGLPEELLEVTIDQKLGDALPLDARLVDSSGRELRLGDLLGQRPAILTFVYYECPMLCTQVLNGLVSALGTLRFDIGKEFDVITVSIDHEETPALAAAKKTVYLERYDRDGASDGWHFLTADKAAVESLTAAAGFRYFFDEDSGQYAHASGAMVVTPEGRLAQYFYGIEFSPRDLRLALVEAADGTIGNPVDQILLYCFAYNPATGRYGAVVMRIMRLAGIVTVLAIGGYISINAALERRARMRAGATS